MAEKSRAQLISEDIMAECQLQLANAAPKLACNAMLQAIGEYLAEIEPGRPDATDRFMARLRVNLQLARSWRHPKR
jgi:hypothetical protein